MNGKPTYIIVKMSDGTKWKIPTHIIALSRTTYYSINDPFEVDSEEWKAEYEQSMKEDELLDWLQSNMNWDDVSNHATVLPNREIVDYNDGIINGEKEFIYEERK